MTRLPVEERPLPVTRCVRGIVDFIDVDTGGARQEIRQNSLSVIEGPLMAGMKHRGAICLGPQKCSCRRVVQEARGDEEGRRAHLLPLTMRGDKGRKSGGGGAAREKFLMRPTVQRATCMDDRQRTSSGRWCLGLGKTPNF